MKKRLLSALLTFCMVLTLLPVSAFAAPSSSADDVVISKSAERVGEDSWKITMTVEPNTQIQAEPMQLVFLMDTSGSMAWCTHSNHGWAHDDGGSWCDYEGENYWEDSRIAVAGRAAKNLLTQLNNAGVNATVSIVTFDSSADSVSWGSKRDPIYQLELNNENLTKIQDKIPTWGAFGSTNMPAGLSEAGQRFQSDASNKVLIMLADGDNDGKGNPVDVASSLKKNGVEIYTIGFTTSNQTLDKVASDDGPGEKHYYTANNADELVSAFTQIANGLSAMVKDDMGDDVSVVGGTPSAVDKNNASIGTINVASNGTLTWNTDEVLGADDKVTITYTVKLNQSAEDFGVGSHDVALNGDAVLTYVEEGSTQTQTKRFEVPTETVEVGSLTTQTMLDGEEYAEGTTTAYEFAYNNENIFNWSLPNEDATIEVNGTTYYYTGSTYDGEPTTGTSAIVTAESHTLIHNYTSSPKHDGTDIPVEVFLDGSPVTVATPEDIAQYLTIGASGTEDFVLKVNDGKISVDFTYENYDCADLVLTPAEGYVLQGIDAKLLGGQNGSDGVTGAGPYTVDNVTGLGGGVLKVYLRTPYKVEYHVAEGTAPTDNGTYITGVDVTSTSELLPSAGAEATAYTWANSELSTTITLEELPETGTTGTVLSGWYDNANMEGTAHRGELAVSKYAEKAKDGVIHFYAESRNLDIPAVPNNNLTVTKTPVTAGSVTLTDPNSKTDTLIQGSDYATLTRDDESGSYSGVAAGESATVLYAVTVKVSNQDENAVGTVTVKDEGAVYEGAQLGDVGLSVASDGSYVLTFTENGTATLYFSKTERFTAEGKASFDNSVTANGKTDSSDPVTVDKAKNAVTVEKTVTDENGGPVESGDVLTYTVTVTNSGNTDLTNVTITDTFTGAGTPVASEGSNLTWTSGEDGTKTATWTIASLAVGKSESVTYTYTVTDADAGTQISNAAVATVDEKPIGSGSTDTPVEELPDDQTVQVVIYRNGNMTEPYKTVSLGTAESGSEYDLNQLDISTLYSEGGTPGEDYVFEGWYNDGGWNDYKAGNPNNTLGGGTITVSGWTNIICMVTDYERVVVYGVTDGVKTDDDVLYSGKALHGENVIDYLEENVENLNRDGYTHDEWFKWDSYGTGYKFSETDTVNGWTNVYVAYTSQEQVVQVVIYRNGDMETPYKTVTLDPMNKGDVLDLTTLDINDYYEADKFAERFLYDGWYNDGAWNLYKAGEDVSGLTSITVNGWTNVIAMVWDEFPVNYHILNSDGEELMSVTDYITAENLESYTFYDPTVEAGYTFDGWYEKAEDIGNESKQATLPLILKKYELYGQMDEIAPDQYTIVYHGNGGYVTRNPEKDQTTSTANVGEYITLKNADTFTRKGYVFQGWALSEDGEVAYQGSQKVLDLAGAGESIDLYAVWAEDTTGKTVRIHWSIDNPEGASWTQSENSSWTETIAWSDRYNTFQLPELEVKEGYHLAGWTVGGAQSNYWSAEAHSFGLAGLIVEDENGGYVSITANIVADEPEDPDAGKTLRIYWAIDNKAGATWTDVGNSEDRTELYSWADRENELGILGVTVNEGYHLSGWTVSGSSSDYWDANTQTFTLNGNYVEDEAGAFLSITANIVADEPEDPDAGKTLRIYWAIDNKAGATWTDVGNSEDRTELYSWADRENELGILGVTVNEGYHLAGWTVSGSSSDYWDANTQTFTLNGNYVEDEAGAFLSITANIVADEPEDPDAGKTLRIYWAIDNKAGATWTDVGNSEDRTELYSWADRENELGVLGVTVNEGYRLAGWTVSGDTSTYLDADTTSFTLDGNYVADENGGFLSITANIVADEPDEETFTVTFDSNGGSSVNAQTVESGKTVAKPADPTRDGYDFEGWFTDEDLTIEYDFDTPVTADITLYAAWDKQNSGGGGGGGSDTETYAVYYHSNYGSDERKFGGRYEEDDEVEVRDNSWWDRDNYRFLGWNTEEDGSGQDYDPEDTFDMPDEDVHLYAQWRRMASDPSESGTDRWLNTSNHISYLTGYPGSIFGPDNSMTRAEVAQMFYALLNDKNVTITKTFPDVPADAWYATAVNTLGTLGMVTGDSKGNFNPNDPITRAEFCAVALAFAYEPEDYDCSFYDVSRSDWFYPYVAQASTYGWIGGYTSGNFGPNDQITRAQVTTIVNNMLGRAADEDYVDEYWDELVQFNDLSDNHWAYYQIMEATNEHDYTKSNGMENWER